LDVAPAPAWAPGFGRASRRRTRLACQFAEKKDFRRYDTLPILQKSTILHGLAGSITFPETTWIPF
jgi:hypothetical protein